jgi:hypothetical protein
MSEKTNPEPEIPVEGEYSMSDTDCPKCGSKLMIVHGINGERIPWPAWECGTQNHHDDFRQSDKCKIKEQQATIERLERLEGRNRPTESGTYCLTQETPEQRLQRIEKILAKMRAEEARLLLPPKGVIIATGLLNTILISYLII